MVVNHLNLPFMTTRMHCTKCSTWFVFRRTVISHHISRCDLKRGTALHVKKGILDKVTHKPYCLLQKGAPKEATLVMPFLKRALIGLLNRPYAFKRLKRHSDDLHHLNWLLKGSLSFGLSFNSMMHSEVLQKKFKRISDLAECSSVISPFMERTAWV